MGADGGDASDILEKKKKAIQAEEKAREREAERTQKSTSDILKKIDLKKGNSSKWAESDDEDDFFSKPVRAARLHTLSSSQPPEEPFCCMALLEALCTAVNNVV